MSRNTRKEKWGETSGELLWNDKYYYYTCEWFEYEELIGGDEPRLQGWEWCIDDDSFRVTDCVDEDGNPVEMTDDLFSEIYWKVVVKGERND